jgi:NAD(P)-dependent dehydrogenase (short-subunit alcohol dehydrogenase family)
MFSLQYKNVVITGGGSGIGRAIALLFATQGAQVHILDLNMQAGRAVVDEIVQEGGAAKEFQCDIANQSAVKAAFHSIGLFDILVNNAGIAHIGKADDTNEDDFDRVMTVNVKGAYNCIHEAIPVFRQNKGGVILNLASIAALVGIPDRFAYSTSKGAILAMTMSVAKDYIHENIRCNSISPARVFTPFVEGFLKKNYPGREQEMFETLSKTQPIGRMAEPKEIAALALYLCSDEAGFISGCDYPIDGGFTKLNN